MKQALKTSISRLFGESENNVRFLDTLRGVSVYFFDIKAVDISILKTKCYLTFAKDGNAVKHHFQDAHIAVDLKEHFLEAYALCKAQRTQAEQDAAAPFGCCNDFLKCSDARRCMHQGETFYYGCMYRKNLESGLIFYGKNRNV